MHARATCSYWHPPNLLFGHLVFVVPQPITPAPPLGPVSLPGLFRGRDILFVATRARSRGRMKPTLRWRVDVHLVRCNRWMGSLGIIIDESEALGGDGNVEVK